MHEDRQLLGSNLLTMFIVGLVLMTLTSGLDGIWGDVTGGCTTLLLVITLPGALYAVIRAFGMRHPAFEQFYGWFPLGLLQNLPIVRAAAGSPGRAHVWIERSEAALFRGFGALVFIIALFLVFIPTAGPGGLALAAAGGGGLLVLGAAEWLHARGKETAASLCAAVGFALWQFGLSLCIPYGAGHGWPAPLLSTSLWLALKMFVAIASLFTLRRYHSEIYALLLFGVAWSIPFSLLYHGGVALAIPVGALFVMLMSGISLHYGVRQRRPGIWILNAVCANLTIHSLFAQHVIAEGPPVPGAIATLVGMALLLFVHLFAAVLLALRTPGPLPLSHHVHAALIAALAAIGVIGLRPQLLLLEDGWGFAMFTVGLFTLAGALMTHGRSDERFSDLLLLLSVLLGITGLFAQLPDRFGGITLIILACLTAWYGRKAQSWRIRGVGLLMLTAGVVALYWESGTLLSSPWGMAALGLAGALLLSLTITRSPRVS